MARGPKKNDIKATKKEETPKINQLELEKTTKNISENFVDDNDSINIKQVESKKITNKIEYNTLATTHFSILSDNINKNKNKKVSQ